MMSDWRDSRGLNRSLRGLVITNGEFPRNEVIIESTGTSELSTEDMLALKRYAEIGINVLGTLIPDRDAQGFLIPINYGPINRLMDIVAKRQFDVANMSAGKFPEPEADETI
jgi:hypothetical protein